MTALTVAIQPATALAEEQTQNPTEASAKVKYEGVDPYYTVVVPTSIQLDEKGEASFNLRAEGDLGGWITNNRNELIKIPILGFQIYSEDEEGVECPGCYLTQEGKEPIFVEFHEETSDIFFKQIGVENYKACPCIGHFCNPLPTWVRGLTAEKLHPECKEDYEGMTQEQFSNYEFGYDMGTTVPITVNLEGNKSVPAGKWEGEIIIIVGNENYKYIRKNTCPEAQKAYDELKST